MAIVYDPTSDTYYDDGTGSGPETSLPEYNLEPETPEFNNSGGGDKGGSALPTPEEAIAVSGVTAGVTVENGQWIGTRSERDARSLGNMTAGRTIEAQNGDNNSFFSSLTGSLFKDMKEKPSSYLKMGLDGFAAANTSQNTKEAAALNRQSAIDQQNNADRLKQAENARYNASFNNSKKIAAPGKKAPLTRTNGQRVFDPNGNIAR